MSEADNISTVVPDQRVLRGGGPLTSVLVFVCLSCGVALLWWYAVNHLRSRQTDNAFASLSAIADLKVDELVQWRARYLDFGASVMKNPANTEWVARIVEHPEDADRRQAMRAWLIDMASRHDFRNALLVDTNFTVLVAASDDHAALGENAIRGGREVLRDQQVLLTDLHTAPQAPMVHMDLQVPIVRGQTPLAVLVFRVDPAKRLFPMIQSWPLPGSSGESLLLRREGNAVVFLNRLRHADNQPLTLRRSLATPNLPAALAVLGMEGSVEGVDYRGARVLAVMRRVPGLPWALVSKVDREEVDAAIRPVVQLLTVTGVALINLAVFAMGFVWYRQRRDLALAHAQAESERRALVRHYVHLSQYANDIILLADGQHKIIEANDRAVRSYGYTRDATLSMTLEGFWPANRQAECAGALRRVEQERAVTLETVHCRAGGQAFPVEVSLRYVEESGLKYTQAVIQDISERIQRRRLLERYQSLCRHARDIILFVGPGGAILEANEAAFKMYGYSAAEILKLNIRDLRALSHRAELGAQLEAAGRESTLFETMHRTKSGSVFPVEVNATPVTIGGERLILSIIRDISHRKGIEEALKTSEQNLRQVMDNVPQAIYARNAEGRIILANQRFAELAGLAYADMAVINETPMAAKDRALDADLLKRGEMLVIPDDAWEGADGALHDMQTTKTVFMPSGNSGPAVLSVSTDITESKRVEEQLRHVQKMDSIGRLAGGMAHEFNNLLQAIMGFTEILMSRLKPGDPCHQDAMEILKATRRAGVLTRQLLAYSRKQAMDVQTRNLNGIVEESSSMAKQLLGEHIRVAVTLTPELTLVRVDAAQIQQVLMNLVINARDAMPSGGTLTITTSTVHMTEADVEYLPDGHAGTFACLSVGDTGVGIDAETRAHMFEPFFTTKQFGEGTGLGLAMVYGIVKQHGGWIDVFSQVGMGSVFRIYLPMEQPVPVAEPPVTPIHPVPAEFQGASILVVEDDDTVRQFAVRVLKEKGFKVFAGRNCEEGLAMFGRQEGGVDLVFTDVVLPDGTGVDLAGAIRARRPDQHVLFASGYLDVAERWPQIRGNTCHFLQKPYSVEALIDHVVMAIKASV